MSFSVGNVDVSNFPPTLTSQQRLVSLSKLANSFFEKIIWTYFQQNNNIKFNGFVAIFRKIKLIPKQTSAKMQFWQFVLIQVQRTNSVIFTFLLLETKLIAVLKSLNGQFGIALHPNYICRVIPPTFRNTLKCQTFPTFKTFKHFFAPAQPACCSGYCMQCTSTRFVVSIRDNKGSLNCLKCG